MVVSMKRESLKSTEEDLIEQERLEEKETSKKERSPRETAELKERLHFVAKLMAKNFDMKMIPGRGWAAGLSEEFVKERMKHPEKSLEEFDPKLLIPETMTYPEEQLLERSEDYIWGVFRHEIGHIKHSDYQSLVEAQDMVEKEGYTSADLFMIYNSWEDGRSNNFEGQTSKTARHRLGAYLKENIAEALFKDFEKHPLTNQYGLLCWAKGAVPFIDEFDFEEIKAKIKDERVLAAFTETEGVLDEYLVEEKGRKAFTDILWSRGWPIFKKLVDQQIEDDAKKEYEREQKEKKSAQEKQEGKKVSESEGGKTEGGESGRPEEVPEESSRAVAPSETQIAPSESAENKGGQERPEPEEEPGNRPQSEQPESWDELSPEAKEQYKKEARKKLTEQERELAEKLQPQIIQIKEREDGTLEIVVQGVAPEDIRRAEQEARERDEEEKQAAQEVAAVKSEAGKKAQQALEKLKEQESGLSKWEREEYDQYFSEVKKYVDMLVEKLDEVFPPQEESGWEGGHRRGKRVDVRKLAREIPTGHGRMFERKEALEIKEAAFTLLIDVSGSMAQDESDFHVWSGVLPPGAKIKQALKAAMLMAEALSRKNLPFEILAYNAQLHELKGFKDDYFGKKKLELMSVLREVRTANAGFNDDGYAVDAAARRLQRQLLENNAHGALIVFSDGQPVPSGAHNGPEWELHGIVNKWAKIIPLVGVGIGAGMEETIKEYYGKNGLPVLDVSKLPRALLDILQKQLARFEQKTQ